MQSMAKITVFLLITIPFVVVNGELNTRMCCPYCRSEPVQWMELGGSFRLGLVSEYTRLMSPAAFLTNDTEKAQYQVEGAEYELSYAGAPIKLVYSDMSSLSKVIKEQYIQIDLASPKYIGGVEIQGGYYEEALAGLFPLKESWMQEFGVTYSNENDHSKFRAMTRESGSVQTFPANTNWDTPELVVFVPGITARYLRIHPLRAQTAQGSTKQVMVRVKTFVCEYEACYSPRIDCLLSDWSAWSECKCKGDLCTWGRGREIRRVQACGGARCGNLYEKEECTPPEPEWMSYVMYIGIVAGLILVGVIIGVVVYKKTHKNDVEVFARDDVHAIPAPAPMVKTRPMLGGQAFVPPSVPPAANPLLGNRNPFAAPPTGLRMPMPKQPGFAGALNTMDDDY